MKRLIAICCVLWLLPLTAAAQSSQIGELFTRYETAEGISSMQLERKMMLMMSRQAEKRGDLKLASMLSDLRYIRILSYERPDNEDFVQAVEEAVAADPRFQLMTASTQEGQTTRFWIREMPITDRTELVMLTYGAKETVVVDIYGAFDLKEVVRLSSIRPSK